MPASLSFLVPDLPSSLCWFCRLLPTLCPNSSSGGFLHHHVFSDALGFCLCWQLSAQLLALVCAHVLIKPKHTVNSWLYHTDFGPSPNLLDVVLALDLSGILFLAFYFFFENSDPLAAPSFLLSELTVVVMPPASQVAFSLMPASGPARQVPRPGPDSLGYSCYHLLIYPPQLQHFLDRLVVLPLFTCLGFKAKYAYRSEQMRLNVSGKSETY